MDKKLLSKLKSLGMTVFVNFYYRFKLASDGMLSLDDLANELLIENPNVKPNTFATQKARGSNGKTIFDDKLNTRALQIILDAKVSAKTKNTVREILSQENILT